eukprot:SAG31_NODE_147_length_22539_cov_37.073663_1_plen_68_part_00
MASAIPAHHQLGEPDHQVGRRRQRCVRCQGSPSLAGGAELGAALPARAGESAGSGVLCEAPPISRLQ